MRATWPGRAVRRYRRAPVWTPCGLRAARTGHIELAAAVTRGRTTQATEVSRCSR